MTFLIFWCFVNLILAMTMLQKNIPIKGGVLFGLLIVVFLPYLLCMSVISLCGSVGSGKSWNDRLEDTIVYVVSEWWDATWE